MHGPMAELTRPQVTVASEEVAAASSSTAAATTAVATTIYIYIYIYIYREGICNAPGYIYIYDANPRQ
jgi:hypothetical protein